MNDLAALACVLIVFLFAIASCGSNVGRNW